MLKIKPSDNDQIGRIAEDQLCQIKSMSTGYTIADLLMSSQKNHQSYQVNQNKVKEIWLHLLRYSKSFIAK